MDYAFKIGAGKLGPIGTPGKGSNVPSIVLQRYYLLTIRRPNHYCTIRTRSDLTTIRTPGHGI